MTWRVEQSWNRRWRAEQLWRFSPAGVRPCERPLRRSSFRQINQLITIIVRLKDKCRRPWHQGCSVIGRPSVHTNAEQLLLRRKLGSRRRYVKSFLINELFVTGDLITLSPSYLNMQYLVIDGGTAGLWTSCESLSIHRRPSHIVFHLLFNINIH